MTPRLRFPMLNINRVHEREVNRPAPANPLVRYVKRWSDPLMQADSYDAKLRGDVGQFQLVSVVQFDAAGEYIGDMSANSTFCNISTAELMMIAARQTADEFSVDQKMGWLLWDGEGTWGAPMAGTYSAAQTWRDAQNIRMIGAVYGGQPVTLTGEHRTFRLRWNGLMEDVPMSRIQPGTWQKVTVAYRDNSYGEEPKGVIWLPLKFRTTDVWIFDRWLAV